MYLSEYTLFSNYTFKYPNITLICSAGADIIESDIIELEGCGAFNFGLGV